MAVTELQPWHTNAEETGIIGAPNNAIIHEKQNEKSLLATVHRKSKSTAG